MDVCKRPEQSFSERFWTTSTLSASLNKTLFGAKMEFFKKPKTTELKPLQYLTNEQASAVAGGNWAPVVTNNLAENVTTTSDAPGDMNPGSNGMRPPFN